jgi:predicted phosphoribosyltransferase
MQDVAMLRRGAVMLAMQVAVMLEAPMQAVAIAAARQ